MEPDRDSPLKRGVRSYLTEGEGKEAVLQASVYCSEPESRADGENGSGSAEAGRR